MNCQIYVVLIFWTYLDKYKCEVQSGPDPWHYEGTKLPAQLEETHLPPDLRTPSIEKQTETKYGFGEWWFKRLLSIMLKSGQVEKTEDDGVHISLQMKFNNDQWGELEDYLKSEPPLSDVMFRKSVGYVEEAIWKPTLTDKIVLTWNEYVQIYLTEYKVHLTWGFGIIGTIGICIQLWKYVSHKHLILVTFLLLYIYEVIISYMEAEQQEYEKFVTAVNKCKWYFWTSECEVPSPDPILFLKHMNPMKIAIRMFTALISEPILVINSTIKVMLHDITDGLWFPFDKIVYGVLIVFINISLLYLLIMIIFNFIFNIPFNLSYFGIIGINVKQSRKSFIPDTKTKEPVVQANTDRISGETLDRLLNVCSLALTNVHNQPTTNIKPTDNNDGLPTLKRSASTGRLPNLSTSQIEGTIPRLVNLKKRIPQGGGAGDH